MIDVAAVVEMEEVGDFWALSGELEPGEVGRVLRVLADYNGVEDLDAPSVVRGLVDAETLMALGGLRVRDRGSGSVLLPSCCCGLEDWREWVELADGVTPWLGHSPTPGVEYAAEAVHLWQDGDEADGEGPGGEGLDGEGPDGERADGGRAEAEEFGRGRVVVPYDRLPELLERVRGELTAFLGLVGEWAEQQGSGLGAALCEKLDEEFSLTEPFGEDMEGAEPTTP